MFNDQGVTDIRIEHDRIACDQKYAADNALAICDVPDIYLEETLCDHWIIAFVCNLIRLAVTDAAAPAAHDTLNVSRLGRARTQAFKYICNS